MCITKTELCTTGVNTDVAADGEMRKDILELLVRELETANIELRMASFVYPWKKDITPKKYPRLLLNSHTACNPAGLIPRVAPEFAGNFIAPNGEYNFLEMSSAVLGIRTDREGGINAITDAEQDLWEFCFGSVWRNNREAAIKRLKYAIKHGTFKKGFEKRMWERNLSC